MHTDTSLFIQSLARVGIPAALQSGTVTGKKVQCFYRNNPDGSIRWVWPVKSTRPHFLKFYHTAGLRAWLFGIAARLAALTGCLRLLASGRFTWYTQENGPLYLTDNSGMQWAWFAGTTGPDRKAILWKRNKEAGAGTFIKIALTPRATGNLETEYRQLQLMGAHAFRNIQLPAVSFTQNCCYLEDIGQHTRRSNRLLKLPAMATQEWLANGLQRMPFGATAFAKELAANMNGITQANDQRFPDSLLNKVQTLYAGVAAETMVPLTTAHGDFTPWNILIKNDRLLLIDWEQSKNGMPFLFDLFHFIYQSNILIGNRGYKSIRTELDTLQSRPEWESFVKQYGCDAVTLEKYYLLYIVSHYLKVYQLQERWHTQVQWLLQTWNEALAWHLNIPGKVSARKMLLQELKDILSDYRYAVLKWRYSALDSLPETADLDICINREDGQALLQTMQRHTLVAAVHIVKRSFMHQAELLLTDGSLLHLDLIHAFKRRQLQFMDAGEVLKNAKSNQWGMMVPAVADDFAYTWLFYWLNNAHIPQHYQKHFEQLRREAAIPVLRMLQHKYMLAVKDFSEVYTRQPDMLQEVCRRLKGNRLNSGIRFLQNYLGYVADTAKNLFPRKGFVITFSGVDGAGKSTVIENTRVLITKQLRRRVVVLRHRPSLLPVLSAVKHGKKKAEQLCAQNLPRQGSNRSLLSSLFRFAYYYTDYLVGQWYVQWRYVNMGYVVLYDRYYFDFINDSRRSNIQLPAPLLRNGYRLLLKPRLNFFLYADENCILSRKRELEPEVIRQLTGSYLHLFEKLQAGLGNARYLPVENIVLTDTLCTVFRYVKNMHHEKIS